MDQTVELEIMALADSDKVDTSYHRRGWVFSSGEDLQWRRRYGGISHIIPPKKAASMIVAGMDRACY